MAAAAISPSILHCFSNSQPAAHPGQCHAGQEGETRQRPSTDGFILVVNLKLVVQVHQLGLVAESVNSEPTSESLGFKFYKKKDEAGIFDLCCCCVGGAHGFAGPAAISGGAKRSRKGQDKVQGEKRSI